MLTANEIGGKIAVARKLRNLSQAQLSEQLAVSAQAVGKWERGESMPDIITFQRIAAILGTDLNYFAGESTVISANVPAPSPILIENSEPSGRPDWNMSGANWIDADFSGLSGLAEKFRGANIEKCRFVESELAGLTLVSNNIKSSDFSRSDLSSCNITSADLTHNIFVGCDFSRSAFSRSNVINCDFSGANLTNMTSRWSYFKKVNMNGAVLFRTKFQLGQLTEVTFTGDIVECTFENCDFARVVFEGAVLRNCFFKNTKLRRAKLIGCKADKLTYAFMKNDKADMTDVAIID